MTYSETDCRVAEGTTEERTCETHGAYVSRFFRIASHTEFWSKCPGCRDDQERERREKEREAARRELAAERLRYSGIPARYKAAGFDAFKAQLPAQKTVIAVARKFAATLIAGEEQPGASLLFVGPPGTGKTHVATAIGITLAADCKWIRYTTVAELTRRVRATYQREAEETEEEVLDGLAGNRLLILDEIGTGALSAHEARIVFDVIDRRYRELLPMVLISNLPTKELEPVIGERIVDRLCEVATTIAFNWKSHRRST